MQCSAVSSQGWLHFAEDRRGAALWHLIALLLRVPTLSSAAQHVHASPPLLSCWPDCIVSIEFIRESNNTPLATVRHPMSCDAMPTPFRSICLVCAALLTHLTLSMITSSSYLIFIPAPPPLSSLLLRKVFISPFLTLSDTHFTSLWGAAQVSRARYVAYARQDSFIEYILYHSPVVSFPLSVMSVMYFIFMDREEGTMQCFAISMQYQCNAMPYQCGELWACAMLSHLISPSLNSTLITSTINITSSSSSTPTNHNHAVWHCTLSALSCSPHTNNVKVR